LNEIKITLIYQRNSVERELEVGEHLKHEVRIVCRECQSVCLQNAEDDVEIVADQQGWKEKEKM
jgi:hypothetical protein